MDKKPVKKILLPLIIIVGVIAVAASVLIVKQNQKKHEKAETSVITTAYETSTANVEKNGFTFKILNKEAKFPMQLKKDFLDNGFTFMRYDELKKIYENDKADMKVIVENVDKNVLFGKSFFSIAVSDSDKPKNSFENTDVVEIKVEKSRGDIFSVNGYGCGDKMKSLINAFGDSFVVISQDNEDIEEGKYCIEYKSGNVSVKITSENGDIFAINAVYNIAE